MTRKRKPRKPTGQPARTPKTSARKPSLALPTPPERRRFRARLLAWYRRHGRSLPWRRTDDPYHILVSEIMLQQTQVDRVLPKYGEWLAKYPTFEALARAPEQEVAATWYPLGYNIRPRRLQTIAREAVARYGGQLPADEETLLSFKGIGAYTAGAIRSFAFRERAAILDTNVARVLFRVFVGRGDPKRHAMKRHLWRLAETLIPSRHVFDFNQALMDLGAMVCVARNPKCLICPMAKGCRQVMMTAIVVVAAVIERDGYFLVTRRQPGAHLEGYWEFPGGKCEAGESHAACLAREIREELGVGIAIAEELLTTTHAYRERRVKLHFLRGEIDGTPTPRLGQEMRWVPRDELRTLRFPPADTELIRLLTTGRTEKQGTQRE